MVGSSRSSASPVTRRPESGERGEGLLSPLAESLRLTTMTAEADAEADQEGQMVLEGADDEQTRGGTDQSDQ